MRLLKFELETVDNFRRGYREDKRNALQMERKQDSINKSPNYAQIFSCFALPRSKKTKKQTCGLIGWVQDIPEISAPRAAATRLRGLNYAQTAPGGAFGPPCPPWRLPGAPDRWRWFRSRPELAARRALPGGLLKALAAGGGSPAPVETGGVPCWPWRLPEGPGGWRRSPGPRSELAAHGARSGLFKMGPDKWPHFKKCDEVNV